MAGRRSGRTDPPHIMQSSFKVHITQPRSDMLRRLRLTGTRAPRREQRKGGTTNDEIWHVAARVVDFRDRRPHHRSRSGPIAASPSPYTLSVFATPPGGLS